MSEKSKKAPSKWHPASVFRRTKKFFTDQKSEMKKIVWPSKKQIINNTGIVLAAIALFAVIVGGFDWLLGILISLLLGA
jgi:preprotein translocase subunit SecE